MREVLYVKYNSLRKPEYQISTSIVSDDNSKYVIKRAMHNKAFKQIISIKNNYIKLKDYYETVKILPYSEVNDGLRFDFVNGNKLFKDEDNIEKTLKQIEYCLNIVFSVNNKYVTDFKWTREFYDIFGDINFENKEPSFTRCNLDSIFDNFIFAEDGIWCLDYEWVMDIIIPQKFLKYRVLAYVYYFDSDIIKKEMSEEDFFEFFDISSGEIGVFKEMENAFQSYVRGKNQKYLYINNYKKSSIKLDDILREVDDQNKHIGNLEKIVKSSNTEISNLQKEVSSKDIHISNLDKVIDGKDVLIDSLKEEIDLKDDHIKNIISEKNVIAEEKNRIMEEKEQQAKDYDSLLKYEHDRFDIEMTRRDQDIIYRDGLLQIQAAQLEKYSKALRNPFYALYLGCKKVIKKVKFLFITKEEMEKEKEIERIGKYKYKYKDLIDLDNIEYEEWIRRREEKYSTGEIFKYNPKISILVPVYNVLDKHLIPCIESVVNQTYDNWELLLVNDCSKDNTLKILANNKIQYVKELCADERTSLNQQDGNGFTALIKACGNGFLECRDILRNAGADTKIVDRDGQTADDRYNEFLETGLRMNRKYEERKNSDNRIRNGNNYGKRR